MRAQEALDYQADLMVRIKGWGMGSLLNCTFHQAGLEGSDFANLVSNHLSTGYTYFVASNMNSLIYKVARDIPEDVLCESIIPPAGCGFVLFNDALETTEARGRQENISALVWGPVRTVEDVTVTLISSWNDTKRHPDHFIQDFMANMNTADDKDARSMQELLGEIGCWSPLSPTLLVNGNCIGPYRYPVPEWYRSKIIAEGDIPTDSVTSIAHLALATWFIMGETVVDVSEGQVQRQFVRRAKRMGLPPRVTVITLRRKSGKTDNETVVEWKHRWPVRGHYRNQRHGSGLSETKKIWIGPHIKGPPDRPLIQTEKVYNLRR